jgi:hypothetical protein
VNIGDFGQVKHVADAGDEQAPITFEAGSDGSVPTAAVAGAATLLLLLLVVVGMIVRMSRNPKSDKESKALLEMIGTRKRKPSFLDAHLEWDEEAAEPTVLPSPFRRDRTPLIPLVEGSGFLWD